MIAANKQKFGKRACQLALLTLFAGLLNMTIGCRTQTADASDPDPHYYKGTNFHGKQRKA